MAFLANGKIDNQKLRMLRLVRHFETRRNRGRRMHIELRRLRLGRDLVGSVNGFVTEFPRQKNWRLRNAKIGRPFRRLVHAPNQRRVFFRREISVKLRAEFRMHFR